MSSWLSREKSLPGPSAGLSPAAFSGWGKGEDLAQMDPEILIITLH